MLVRRVDSLVLPLVLVLSGARFDGLIGASDCFIGFGVSFRLFGDLDPSVPIDVLVANNRLG